MYQIGERVVYGIHGVCTIVAEEQIVDRTRRTYLVLEPVGHTESKFMVPAHNETAMRKLRKILSRDELNAMISGREIQQDCWINDENSRKQAYRDLITSGDRIRLLQMVRAVYLHKEAQTRNGRKCHMSDENFLRDAEKLLISEISIVMDLEPEDAKKYLRINLLRT